MNAARQATWMFCLLIALACSGWYFASSPSLAKLDAQTLATTPDSIVIDLTIRQFTPAGTLANFLESPEMQHIPEKSTNLFKSPHIISNQENQVTWDIRAQKATSINKGEQITFTHDVIIHQHKDNEADESTFKTEELVYFPKTKFATTTCAIVIEQPGSIVHSKGMNAYLADNRIELSKAHATYTPKHA